MTGRTGFHRNWRRWQPSDAQCRVLDALLEGKTNAVIADDLGISAETVKWHISEMLAETGLEDRQALAQWWQEERPHRQRLGVFAPLLRLPRVAIATPVAVAAVIALLVVVLSARGSGPGTQQPPVGEDIGRTPAPEARTEDPGPPGTCEPPDALDLRIVTPEELRAEGLVSIGQLFDSKYCPVYGANRTDRAFIWVGGNAVLDLNNPPSGWSYEGTSEIGVTLQQGSGGPMLEAVTVGLRSKLSGAGVSVDQSQGTAVTLRTGGDGGYLMVLLQEYGNFRRVAVASNGEVFVSPSWPALETVVNRVTGEAIDVSGMRQLSQLPAGLEQGQPQAITKCSGTTCLVQYGSVPAGMGAPMTGRLVCPEGAPTPGLLEFDLEASDLKLHFRTLDPNRTAATLTCESRDVAAGDPLPVSNIVFITAVTPGGTPLSIIASYGGTLYVGEVRLRFPCPCGWDF